MKRNEIYSVIAIALVCILALSVVFTSNDVSEQASATTQAADTTEQTTTQAPQTTMPPATTAAPATTVPATQDTTAPAADDTTAATDTTAASQPQESAGSTLPSTPAEILSKYTEVMNKAKTDKVGYKKVEFQGIPTEKAQFDGKVINAIVPVLSNFMTDEATATANPEVNEKGGDMKWFPVQKTSKGCLLTDASAIKTASCTQEADGNVKITIVLNDEQNSAPAPENAESWTSTVGSVFSPINVSDIENTLQTNTAVKMVAKDIKFIMTYTDCTAELIYNPTTNQIVSLNQYLHMNVNITEGKILGSAVTGVLVVDNTLLFSEFQY